MQKQGPENPTNPKTRALANALKEPWTLSWQETLADFLHWKKFEGEEAAEAVRYLRSHEYHQIPPSSRYLILGLLCEPCMELPEIREAIDRRIEWSSSQPWSWRLPRRPRTECV